MGKFSNLIIIVVLFIVFFEIGLFSSYTIVTSEAPDVKGLIDLQVQKISSVFSPEKVNNVLIKDSTPVEISNTKEVARQLENISNVDGVNLESLNVTTNDDTDNKVLNVTIEALGYETPTSNSSSIVISQDPNYKIIAYANATYKSGELEVETSSIHINSILKLY